VYPFTPSSLSLIRTLQHWIKSDVTVAHGDASTARRALVDSAVLGVDRGFFGCVTVAQIDVDEGEEEFQVQWLGEVFVGAGVSKSPNLARRRVGREHDDRNVGGRRIKAEPFQDFKTLMSGRCTSRSMSSG